MHGMQVLMVVFVFAACSRSCISCDIDGEGKCDPGKCKPGHVFNVVDKHCDSKYITVLHCLFSYSAKQCYDIVLTLTVAYVTFGDSLCVPVIDSFVYLGSLQISENSSRPDIKRRIRPSLAASVMSSLSRIWRDKILQLSTKIRLYQALVMSVLLYAAETWTLPRQSLRPVATITIAARDRHNRFE